MLRIIKLLKRFLNQDMLHMLYGLLEYNVWFGVHVLVVPDIQYSISL